MFHPFAALFFLGIFLFCFAGPANAHRPYALYSHTIQDENPNSYIVEKLYGDGIFFADPVRLQVRNENGTVVAFTYTGKSVASLCFSTSFCYAFVDQGLGIGTAYKLLPETLNPDSEYKGKDVESLKSYLLKEEKYFRSYDNGYPESESNILNFKPANFLWLIPSFFILLISQYIVAPIIFVCAAAYQFATLLKPTRKVYRILKIIGLLVLGIFNFLLWLGVLMYGELGVLHLLFIAGIVLLGSNYCKKRISRVTAK